MLVIINNNKNNNNNIETYHKNYNNNVIGTRKSGFIYRRSRRVIN